MAGRLMLLQGTPHLPCPMTSTRTILGFCETSGRLTASLADRRQRSAQFHRDSLADSPFPLPRSVMLNRA